MRIIGLATGVAILTVLSTTACGGRAPKPVPVARSTDAYVTCDHIDSELRANHAREAELREEHRNNNARTLARFPTSILTGPPIGAILLADFGQAVYTELSALAARNVRLHAMAHQRHCASRIFRRATNRPNIHDHARRSF
jgi:hypothetical protein